MDDADDPERFLAELAEEAAPQLRPTHLEQLGSYGSPDRDPRLHPALLHPASEEAARP